MISQWMLCHAATVEDTMRLSESLNLWQEIHCDMRQGCVKIDYFSKIKSKLLSKFKVAVLVAWSFNVVTVKKDKLIFMEDRKLRTLIKSIKLTVCPNFWLTHNSQMKYVHRL